MGAECDGVGNVLAIRLNRQIIRVTDDDAFLEMQKKISLHPIKLESYLFRYARYGEVLSPLLTSAGPRGEGYHPCSVGYKVESVSAGRCIPRSGLLQRIFIGGRISYILTRCTLVADDIKILLPFF